MPVWEQLPTHSEYVQTDAEHGAETGRCQSNLTPATTSSHSPFCEACCLISSPVEKESTQRCNQHIHLLQRSATELAYHLGMKKCLKRHYKTKYLEKLKLLQKQKKFVKRRGIKQTRLLTSKARIIQFQCDTWVFHSVPTVLSFYWSPPRTAQLSFYSSFFTPISWLYGIVKIPLSLLASRLNHLSSFQPLLIYQMPQSPDQLLGPSLDPLQCIRVFTIRNSY